MYLGLGLTLANIQPSGGSATGVPTNTSLPAIIGGNWTGGTLTINAGSWTDTPTQYTFNIYRGVTLVSTTTQVGDTLTYNPVVADVAQNMTCRVTAINGFGSSSPATSNIVTIIDTLLWTTSLMWGTNPLKWE